MAKRLSAEDLAHTPTYAREALQALKNSRLFLTGGTGFFGHWLLESLLHANREFGLNIQATVLTRSPASFRQKSPHLAGDPAIHLHAGDIRSFEFPAENFTHIIHAATDVVTPGDGRPVYDLAESIVDGTRRVLQLAQSSSVGRLLYVSSGAVYGRSSTVPFTPETYTGAPDPLVAATEPPRPPPHVTTGIFALLAASRPAPIEDQGNTMSMIAPAPRWAKFWIAAFA